MCARHVCGARVWAWMARSGAHGVGARLLAFKVVISKNSLQIMAAQSRKSSAWGASWTQARPIRRLYVREPANGDGHLAFKLFVRWRCDRAAKEAHFRRSR